MNPLVLLVGIGLSLFSSVEIVLGKCGEVKSTGPKPLESHPWLVQIKGGTCVGVLIELPKQVGNAEEQEGNVRKKFFMNHGHSELLKNIKEYFNLPDMDALQAGTAFFVTSEDCADETAKIRTVLVGAKKQENLVMGVESITFGTLNKEKKTEIVNQAALVMLSEWVKFDDDTNAICLEPDYDTNEKVTSKRPTIATLVSGIHAGKLSNTEVSIHYDEDTCKKIDKLFLPKYMACTDQKHSHVEGGSPLILYNAKTAFLHAVVSNPKSDHGITYSLTTNWQSIEIAIKYYLLRPAPEIITVRHRSETAQFPGVTATGELGLDAGYGDVGVCSGSLIRVGEHSAVLIPAEFAQRIQDSKQLNPNVQFDGPDTIRTAIEAVEFKKENDIAILKLAASKGPRVTAGGFYLPKKGENLVDPIGYVAYLNTRGAEAKNDVIQGPQVTNGPAVLDVKVNIMGHLPNGYPYFKKSKMHSKVIYGMKFGPEKFANVEHYATWIEKTMNKWYKH